MADFNSMQGSLGLNGAQAPTPAGVATAPVQMPVTRHPGEMAALLSQAAQATAFSSAQVTNISTPGATVGIVNPSMANVGGVMMPGTSALSMFGAQFAQNAQNIRLATGMPAYAPGSYGTFGGGGGGYGPVPGLQSGMLPYAGMMSDPSLGIYRSAGMHGYAMQYPALPREPLLRNPFVSSVPPPLFNTSMGQALDLSTTRSFQLQGLAAAGVGTATRGAFDIVGGGLGAALGAYGGALLGGPMGAGIGRLIGGAAGFLGMDSLLGKPAGDFVAPMLIGSTAQRTAQLQGITNNFVTGGANVGPGGRGINPGDATRLQKLVNEAGYSDSLGFNPSDLTRVMDISGRVGLMDASQGLGDIKDRVTKVAQTLRQFMQIANEPDVVNAIRELGNMRSLGLNPQEAMGAARNARQFARMAGTTLGGLSQYGQAGAFSYQQNGLSAGLGTQVGQGAYAMANQMVGSGTFTEQQLAMLGGTAGLAQRQMEASAAFLKVPMLAASVSRASKDGMFSLDPKLVAKLVSGEMDVNGMAVNATQNLNEAVALNGVEGIGAYQMQEGELQDQLGRVLGPEGIQYLMMNQVKSTMGMLGLKGASGYSTAAQILFRDKALAQAITQAASNPEYFKNMSRAVGVREVEEGAEQRADEQNREERYYTDYDRRVEGALYDLGISTGNAAIGDFAPGATKYFGEIGQDSAARDVGAAYARVDRRLVASSDAVRRNLRALDFPTGGARVRSLDEAARSVIDPVSGAARGQGILNSANMLRYVYEREGRSADSRFFKSIGLGLGIGDNDIGARFLDQQEGAIYSRQDAGLTDAEREAAAAKVNPQAIAEYSAAIAMTANSKIGTTLGKFVHARGMQGAYAGGIAGGLMGGYVGGGGGVVLGAGILSAPAGAAGFLAGSAVGDIAGNVVGYGIGAATGYIQYKTGMHGSAALTGDDYKKAASEALAKAGLPATEENIEAVRRAGHARAALMNYNPKAFNGDSGGAAYTADQYNAINEAAKKEYERLGGTYIGGGTVEQQADFFESVMAGASNEKVSTLATLKLGGMGATPDERQSFLDATNKYMSETELTPAEMREAEVIALDAAKTASNMSLARDAGKKLFSLSAADMTSSTKAVRDPVLAMYKQQEEYSGLRLLKQGTNTDLANTLTAPDGAGGIDGLINAIQAAGGSAKLKRGNAADEYLYTQTKILEEALAAAGVSGKKKMEARKAFGEAINLPNPVTAEEMLSGYQTDASTGLRIAGASTAASMSKDFPRAIGTFRDSALALHNAAVAISRAYGTRPPPRPTVLDVPEGARPVAPGGG